MHYSRIVTDDTMSCSLYGTISAVATSGMHFRLKSAMSVIL